MEKGKRSLIRFLGGGGGGGGTPTPLLTYKVKKERAMVQNHRNGVCL